MVDCSVPTGIMYNPVAHSWRAKSETHSKFNRSPAQTCSLEDSQSPLRYEGYGYETYEKTPRRRRGKNTRKPREPAHKPPWDDCTVVTPLPKRSKSHQVWGSCRKPEPERPCPPPCAKRSQGDPNIQVKTVDICDGKMRRKKSNVPVTRECNVSNNQRTSMCVRGRRSQRDLSLHPLSPATSSCQRKKAVAFHPQPVACAQIYGPDRELQRVRGRAKTRKFGNYRKTKAPHRSIIKIPESSFYRPGCCSIDSYYQPVENGYRHSSAPSLHNRTSLSKPWYIEDVPLEQPVTRKSSKSRLSSLESKAFKFLAQRLLDKSPANTPPTRNQMHGTLRVRNNNAGFEKYVRSPTAKQSPYFRAENTVNNWDAPATCLQGRGKSKPPKKTAAHSNTPRSKSLHYLKSNKKVIKKSSNSSSSGLDSSDDYTRAKSRMRHREGELFEKYGPSTSESDLACSTEYCPYYPLDAPMSQPFEGGYHFQNLCSPIYGAQAYKNKPFCWNSSEIERNFSQNRHPFGPTRIRTPMGTSDGFARHYAPPSEVAGKSSAPWSSVLRISTLPSRSYGSVPCAEVRLIGKYLDDDGSTRFSAGRNASKSPEWWANKYFPEENNGQTEVKSQVRTDNFPWRRKEGSSDRISNPSKLDQLLGRNSSNSWSSSRVSQSILGEWKKGDTEKNSKFTSYSTKPLSSYGGGTIPARDPRNTSLNSKYSVERLGSDTACANTFSKSLTLPMKAASSLFVPDSCASQTSSLPKTGKISKMIDEWQAVQLPGPDATESYLRGEAERLRKIGLLLG